MKNPVAVLRALSLAEGVSFLVLLGIAMPLKYWAGLPLAVRLAGSVHGALFLVFCWALVRATLAARWPWSRAGLVLVAALVPFAPLWLDRHLRGWAADYTPSGG
jgi:integral membrane protein